jgi:hypothetical protein
MLIENLKMCEYCKMKLRPINTGKKHYYSDWKSRKYHKNCYKKMIKDFQYEEFIKDLNNNL